MYSVLEGADAPTLQVLSESACLAGAQGWGVVVRGLGVATPGVGGCVWAWGATPRFGGSAWAWSGHAWDLRLCVGLGALRGCWGLCSGAPCPARPVSGPRSTALGFLGLSLMVTSVSLPGRLSPRPVAGTVLTLRLRHMIPPSRFSQISVSLQTPLLSCLVDAS